MKKVNNCPVCKCEMWLPDELCEAALKSSKIGFYCAYGHSQHFSDDCIKAYWAKDWSKPAEQTVTKNQNPNNVFPLFKAKGHEAQPNP